MAYVIQCPTCLKWDKVRSKGPIDEVRLTSYCTRCMEEFKPDYPPIEIRPNYLKVVALKTLYALGVAFIIPAVPFMFLTMCTELAMEWIRCGAEYKASQEGAR